VSWCEGEPSLEGFVDFEANSTNYAFAIFSNVAQTEDYTLHVQEFLGDDYGSYQGDTPDVGAVTLNGTNSGVLQVPPDVDVFSFSAVAGKTYALYSADRSSFSVHMYADWSWPGNYPNDRFTAPDVGTCRVQVDYMSATGAYQFTVSEFLDDADNSKADAIPLTVGGASVANALKAPGDQDWPRSTRTGPEVTIASDYAGPYYVTVCGTPSTGAYTAQVELAGSDPSGPPAYSEWAAAFDLGDKGLPDDDADDDGFSNEQERIAGANPTDKSDLFRASQVGLSSSGTGLILADALPGRRYIVRASEDLLRDIGTWAEVSVTIENGKVVAALDPAQLNAYYRLFVELE